MESPGGFRELMSSLWKAMKIDLPSGLANEVYTIAPEDQNEVHLLSTHEGMLDIISEAGTLHNKQAGKPLLELLALNQPPLAVNVDNASGTVMVWTRQKIADLEVEDVIRLVNKVMETVQEAKKCVDCSDTRELFNPDTTPAVMHFQTTGETTLSRLRRRN